jgi:hypothetical protein
MRYLHHSALLNNGVRLFIIGFPWLQRTPFLADVTMEIKAYTLPKAAKLY